MDISINANYFWRKRSCGINRTHEEKIKLCVDAGFRVLDYSVDVDHDNWEYDVDEILNVASKYGAVIQSHAPFNFYLKQSPEIFAKKLDRSVEAAIKMGIKTLVFHADEYHPSLDAPWDSDQALRRVYDCLAPHIDKLIKGGVSAGLETVFEEKTKIPKVGERTHFCADTEELIAIIDKFNDEKVGCCWDFGHAKLAVGNNGHADAIRRMGKRIICTHVHDNIHGDEHLQPFLGDANWERIMPALKETGYNGSLTLEFAHGNMHEELTPLWIEHLNRTAKVLVRMFEGK